MHRRVWFARGRRRRQAFVPCAERGRYFLRWPNTRAMRWAKAERDGGWEREEWSVSYLAQVSWPPPRSRETVAILFFTVTGVTVKTMMFRVWRFLSFCRPLGTQIPNTAAAAGHHGHVGKEHQSNHHPSCEARCTIRHSVPGGRRVGRVRTEGETDGPGRGSLLDRLRRCSDERVLKGST